MGPWTQDLRQGVQDSGLDSLDEHWVYLGGISLKGTFKSPTAILRLMPPLNSLYPLMLAFLRRHHSDQVLRSSSQAATPNGSSPPVASSRTCNLISKVNATKSVFDFFGEDSEGGIRSETTLTMWDKARICGTYIQ